MPTAGARRGVRLRSTVGVLGSTPYDVFVKSVYAYLIENAV